MEVGFVGFASQTPIPYYAGNAKDVMLFYMPLNTVKLKNIVTDARGYSLKIQYYERTMRIL